MTIYERSLTRSGTVRATFDKNMKLTSCKHLNGPRTKPVRPGGLLWTKMQKRSSLYRYQTLR